MTKVGDKMCAAHVHEDEDNSQSDRANETKEEPTIPTKGDSENEAIAGSEGADQPMSSDGGGGLDLRRRFNTQRGRWRCKDPRDGSVSGSSSCSRTSPSEIELEAFPRAQMQQTPAHVRRGGVDDSWNRKSFIPFSERQMRS